MLGLLLSIWVHTSLGQVSFPAPKTPPSTLNLKVDSLLKSGSMVNRDDDSLAQVEADTSLTSVHQGLPFELKKPSKQVVALFQAAILKAVTALEKKDFPKARSILSKVQPTERLAQVYKTLLLARAYAGENDFGHADSVVQGCLAWVGGSVWQSELVNLRIQIFPQTSPSDSARLQFYTRVIQAPISGAVKVNFLYNLLKLQGFVGDPTGYEMMLKRIVEMAPPDKRLDSLYRSLAPNVPSGFPSWALQNLLLDMESKLGLYTQAIVRSDSMLKLTPNKIEKEALHLRYANFHFKNKDFPNAIGSFTKFIERYGETPDVLLQIARCYDRLQEPKKALIWYDRFLEKYPKQDKTSEIFWLRAWDLESQGNFIEATEFYYRQLADFSTNKRGDWANFRIGVCQFKAGNSAAALQAFHAIRSQVNSNAYAAGLFWEGRSQEVLKDTLAAKSTWTELTLKYPFQFYGHLAKQTLISKGWWADSLEVSHRMTSSSSEAIKTWMKSEMSGFHEKLDDDFESQYLSIGKLLQFKLDTLAVLTLRTIPAKVESNPWFLYIYSRIFRNRQLWKESYRLGLKLSYKMEPDKWGEAPKEVLRLIFPRPYEAFVQKYSAKRLLDPAFIYALMRQESGFDREIKSGAGALGLMQLMPSTAKNVAKKERLKNFDPFSLVEADININLGTAYLFELKKQYRENSYFILANYNAGPEATKRWQASSRDKTLEMTVEDISYWETRDYVKKVMGNFWTYRSVWNNRVKTNNLITSH